MSSPLPPEILDPQGRTLYLNPYRQTYTANRAYAYRQQRGFARGLTQSEARGHAVRNGLTESQRRQRPSYSESAFAFQARHGVSLAWWRRMRRLYINPMNAMASPGNQITLSFIDQEMQNAPTLTAVTQEPAGPEWMEQRLAERLYAMDMYREGNSQPGFAYFQMRTSYRPIEWWYYH